MRMRFERLREASGWPTLDLAALHQAHESLWILHQISNASVGGAEHSDGLAGNVGVRRTVGGLRTANR